MHRNLDMTALRAFVTVAETGGVTKAAGRLHLTQSTVSMQLKRLESVFGQPLVKRDGRGIMLTTYGEQLLGYGRHLLAVNDEAMNHMAQPQLDGELNIGVALDILYPHIPLILNDFNKAFPKTMIKLVANLTVHLIKEFENGNLDLILTTESAASKAGERLIPWPLKWYGASNAQAWNKRPLPLTCKRDCVFRQSAIHALEDHGIQWSMSFTASNCSYCIPYISADLGVTNILQGTSQKDWEEAPSSAGMPDLPNFCICHYVNDENNSSLVHHLASIIRDAYTKNSHLS